MADTGLIGMRFFSCNMVGVKVLRVVWYRPPKIWCKEIDLKDRDECFLFLRDIYRGLNTAVVRKSVL